MKITGGQIAGGSLLVGVFWLLTKQPKSDVIDEGEDLVLSQPSGGNPWQPGDLSPVGQQASTQQRATPSTAGTPGTLRVDLGLSVPGVLVGLAMTRAREAVTPSKLKAILTHMSKTCPALPAPTGTGKALVAAGGPGVMISVRVPVLFTAQQDAALKACIEKVLRKSSPEINERLSTITVRAEK